ncbi:MAG TPA: sigma-70 family RNA polymerase sigma factor [Ramlibacter sp.]|jgi:RNA polymerase sigma factor for flagellar operon FliA
MMQPAVAAGEELALWHRLRQEGDADARADLLRLHLPYARVVAATYYRRRFHDEIEFGDYHQYASIGLLEAMERFDPGRGAQFRTFAARRMHGAILNGIERLTEKQQQIAARKRARAEQLEANKALAAERVGIGAGTLPTGGDPLLHYMAEVGVGLALAWMLEGTAMVEDAARGQPLPFYRSTEIRQLRERLLQVIEALPSPERTVIRCHYLQEIPFDQVAVMLQLSKGRVSQIHKQALLRLRSSLGDHDGLDLSF